MISKRAFRQTTLASVMALSVFAAPMAALAETLGDALASAYRTSGLLEQNRANLRATDEGVAQALSDLRPSLSYNASKTFRRTDVDGSVDDAWVEQLQFIASMTLYTFGKNRLAVDAARETVLATRASLVNIEQSVLADAVTAYMDVREARALVNLRDSAIRLNTQNLRAARDRFDVGEVTRTEVSQYEAQLASARAELAAAQGQLATAREAYKVAVGSYPQDLASPPRISLPASSVEGAVAVALRGHPALVALQHQVAARELAVQIAEKNMLPTVDASASVTSNDLSTFDNTTSSIGVSISGPIYSGGAIASAIREAKANRDATRANLLQASREIEQSVRANWAFLSVYAAAAEASDASVEANRVAYDGVREEAELGASTALDVLDAEQDLLDAQVTAIQARIAQENQVYIVLQSMGLLTVDHLNLNVPVYDPSAYYNAVSTAPVRNVSPQGEKLDRVLNAIMPKQ